MTNKLWFLCVCYLQVFGLVAQEITPANYPNADSVTVNEIEKVKYNPDGTYEQTDECWTKILTEKGRRQERLLSLDYSRRYGEAAILYVGAIGEDGVERAIDVSQTTKDSTDNSSMAANIYDPLDRKIVCTIPDLQVGETLHVKTMRKTTKPRCKDKWADLSVMEWSHPIIRATYEVTAPASRPLKKIAIRNPLGNIVTNVTKLADGSLVHTFTVTNSAQAFPEPDMPPLYTQIQNIRVSTAADWPEISKWYWELCVPHLSKTNAAMVAKAKELKTIEAIFKFVSQEVRYMGLTMEDTSPGYAPHDVDVTFNNRYGVCRDKAGLLVAMLRLAGFHAYPVLIHVGAKLDPVVPQPFFNHAIVAVDQGNRQYQLMDPTNENTKDLFPSYLCNNSYLVARPDGEELATSLVPPPEKNGLDVYSTAALSRDGSMFFESMIDLKGVNDTMYRGVLAKRTPEEQEKIFERILKSVSSGAELVKCEIRPKDLRDTTLPLSVKLAARFPEMVIRGETRDELTIPTISKSLGLVNWLLEGNTSLEKRRFTLKLDTTARVSEHLTIELNGVLGDVIELPQSEKTAKGYDYERTFATTNGVLTLDRSLTVSAVEFSPEAYLNLREEIKRVEAAERKKPIFASNRLHDANVHQILDSSETTLISDTSWVTTNIDVMEVLTYKGKKDSAELKFTYHPAWKTIDILEASVSNRDGRVYSVTPKEINVMDCAWASSAPRYAAGKIKVVNLPSVEIGSVISVKTVVSVTNAPAPFYTCLYFDSFLPIDRLVRRVGEFRYEATNVKRISDEPSQPSGVLWRKHKIITRGDWVRAAQGLYDACEVEPLQSEIQFETNDIQGLRNWMAKSVKVVGPSLYELPLELQVTDPQIVLKERYATRLDYVRTLCALLRGAGYEADVVFAANNASEVNEIRELDQFKKPNIRAYSLALCRVREREGGFLWFGGETKEYFLGTENEYTPIGATGYEGSDYFDPMSGEFGIVQNVDLKYETKDEEYAEFLVRENGAVDMNIKNRAFGAQVGVFRKKFNEILPEMRDRFYQSLLGDIAQAASATSELETDTKGYPAETRFSCFVPDYATVNQDTLSITLPAFDEVLPNLTGAVRETPLALGVSRLKCEQIVVKFPEGYTEIEHLPESFDFSGHGFLCLANVSSKMSDGVLTVTIDRSTHVRTPLVWSSEYAANIKELRRRASSRANRTITVRRVSARDF